MLISLDNLYILRKWKFFLEMPDLSVNASFESSNDLSGAFVRLQNSILYDEVDFRGVNEVSMFEIL